MTLRPAGFDFNIKTLHVAGFSQTLAQSGQIECRFRRCGIEDTEDRHPGLLRARGERPWDRRAAEKRNELAPFQLTELHPLPLAEAA